MHGARGRGCPSSGWRAEGPVAVREGVIYVATGADYRALAVASAASLRTHEPYRPIDLFTDVPDAPGLGVFDRIHPVPRDDPRVKLDCMPLSRFERTLFLDADTRVLAPLGDLFDLLERFDLALAHDVRRRSALIREGACQTPYAFPQFNSGVLLYRRSPAMAGFFADWRRRFDASGCGRDQPALKDLLWQSDIRFHVLPPEFNLRRVTMLDAWEPLDAVPTILHSHRLLQHLRGQDPVAGLEALQELERRARGDEWRLAGLGDPARTSDPLAIYAEVPDDDAAERAPKRPGRTRA